MIYSIKMTSANDESIFIMATSREQLRIYQDRFTNEPKIIEYKVRKEK